MLKNICFVTVSSCHVTVHRLLTALISRQRLSFSSFRAGWWFQAWQVDGARPTNPRGPRCTGDHLGSDLVAKRFLIRRQSVGQGRWACRAREQSLQVMGNFIGNEFGILLRTIKVGNVLMYNTLSILIQQFTNRNKRWLTTNQICG